MLQRWRHKEKILVVGLPRSGTTIAANYLNSLDRAFCFLEPHWEYESLGSTEFFHDPKLRLYDIPKLRRYVRLRYDPDATLPLDKPVRRILWRYDLVGIKETFRGNHYASYDSKLPNEDLLRRYSEAGYRLLPVVRDPLAVWNSFCGHFSPADVWAGDLEAFIENFRRLYEFAGDDEVLVYERFVKDPAGEMARMGISSEGFGGRITTRRAAMGDAGAKGSTEVAETRQPVHYTTEQRQALEASAVMGLYDRAVARSEESPGLGDGVESPASG